MQLKVLGTILERAHTTVPMTAEIVVIGSCDPPAVVFDFKELRRRRGFPSGKSVVGAPKLVR